MSGLVDRPIPIQEVLAASAETAKALEDPVRSALLDLLAHEPMSVQEMVAGLADQGIEKAPTTVRHHVDVLREAGLIELGRLEEVRGGVVKYYAATTRFLEFDEPATLEDRLAPALETMAQGLRGLLDQVREAHGPAISEMAEDLRPCPHCDRSHFEEYVLVRLVQRGLAQALHPADDRGEG